MEKKSCRSGTMRGIATAADMGEATIYNCFPCWEANAFAYCEDHAQDCIEALKLVDSFNTFVAKERLEAATKGIKCRP